MAVIGDGAAPNANGRTDAEKAGKSAATKLANVYAGSACNIGSAGTLSNGAICAKFMPIQVAGASSACNCTGSTCSVAFKYY